MDVDAQYVAAVVDLQLQSNAAGKEGDGCDDDDIGIPSPLNIIPPLFMSGNSAAPFYFGFSRGMPCSIYTYWFLWTKLLVRSRKKKLLRQYRSYIGHVSVLVEGVPH